MDDLGFERRPFNGGQAYKQSKQANRLLTWHLAEQLEGCGVTVNAIHPGPVNSELNRDFVGIVGNAMKAFFKVFGKTPANGADPAIFVGASPALESTSGAFYPGRKPTRCKFRDPVLQKALYEHCQAQTKIH